MAAWPAQYHRSPKVARYCGKAKQYTTPNYHIITHLGGHFTSSQRIPSRDGGLHFSYHNDPLNRISSTVFSVSFLVNSIFQG